ncbi:MAG: hypothetical protein R2911_37270 [Caldilineaceae bacterium]
MADYCNILRSHNADDVLTVQVLRFDTKEMLEGQINGRVLEQSFSFADTLEEGSAGAAGSTTGNGGQPEETYSGYTTVSDSSGVLSVEVPVEWTDVRDGDWTVDDQAVGLRLATAPDLDAFFESWGMPGVFFSASADLLKTTDEPGCLIRLTIRIPAPLPSARNCPTDTLPGSTTAGKSVAMSRAAR